MDKCGFGEVEVISVALCYRFFGKIKQDVNTIQYFNIRVGNRIINSNNVLLILKLTKASNCSAL